MDKITYIIESTFHHFATKERMYRVKRIFTSGGIDFVVYTDKELKRITGMEVV